MTSSPVTVLMTSGPVMNMFEVWSTISDEVGERRRVDVTARAGAEDQADLRDDAGGQHVAVEDLAVAREAHDPFLDTGAAALVEPDDRAAGLEREVHDLDDLLAVDLAERAAEHGHVVAEDADRTAVDRAVAGDARRRPPAGCGPARNRWRGGGRTRRSRRRTPGRGRRRCARGPSSCPWSAEGRPPSASRRARPPRCAA